MSKIIFFAVLVIGGLIAREFIGNQSSPTTTSIAPPPITSIPKPDCNIKGNISHNSQRKLYHIPGMQDYEGTNIDPTYGERWFCTEAEARENGWQKAPN